MRRSWQCEAFFLQAFKNSYSSDTLGRINNPGQDGLKGFKYDLVNTTFHQNNETKSIENGKKHEERVELRFGEKFVIYQSNVSSLQVVDVVVPGPNNRCTIINCKLI